MKGFDDYRKLLRGAYVLLDKAERRDAISADATRAAKNEDLRLVETSGLLEDVTGLIEWPVVLLGNIDPKFMDLPSEVLTTTMRTHQKYLSLIDRDGKVAPHFLMISNMQTSDGGKEIIAGNERVLRARLADAQFFWDKDQRYKLVDWFPGLHEMVFHTKLGSLAERSFRLQELADHLASQMNTKAGLARRAGPVSYTHLTLPTSDLV